MKPKTALTSCTTVAILVAGIVSPAFAQDGRYRLSGSDRYNKVPTDARVARLKAANDRFNQNYGKVAPKVKTPTIRINETDNTIKPFLKNTSPGGIRSNPSAARPNTIAQETSTYVGKRRLGTTGSSAISARPNSFVGKGMTTARTASSAKPVASVAKGASVYKNLQSARSGKQVVQGARTAKAALGAAKGVRMAAGFNPVGLAGIVATEIVLQEIEDPGKTVRDLDGTVKDIETGQFISKAGQKVNKAISDTGKTLDQAGKDVGNFVNGIFR